MCDDFDEDMAADASASDCDEILIDERQVGPPGRRSSARRSSVVAEAKLMHDIAQRGKKAEREARFSSAARQGARASRASKGARKSLKDSMEVSMSPRVYKTDNEK